MLVQTVKLALECLKLLEGRLAHKTEHTGTGMLGGNFQATADMVTYQLTGVGAGGGIHVLVVALV